MRSRSDTSDRRVSVARAAKRRLALLRAFVAVLRALPAKPVGLLRRSGPLYDGLLAFLAQALEVLPQILRKLIRTRTHAHVDGEQLQRSEGP